MKLLPLMFPLNQSSGRRHFANSRDKNTHMDKDILPFSAYLRKDVHVVLVSVGHFEFALNCRASHGLQVNPVHV